MFQLSCSDVRYLSYGSGKYSFDITRMEAPTTTAPVAAPPPTAIAAATTTTTTTVTRFLHYCMIFKTWSSHSLTL